MKVNNPLMGSIENRRPLHLGTNLLRGRDYLGPVVVKASTNINTPADRILQSFPVTPSGYPGTRITQLSPLWERYRFRYFRVSYVPSVPNTIACQLVLYVDTDPNDDPTTITTADGLIRQAVAQTGAQQWNFNNPKVTPLALRRDDQWYYTGNDKQNERFNRMGTGYLIQITDPINFNGELLTDDLTSGSLFIDWECEFQIPQIEPAAASSVVKTTFTRSPGFVGNLVLAEPGFVAMESGTNLLTGVATISLKVGGATVQSASAAEPAAGDLRVTMTGGGAFVTSGTTSIGVVTSGVEASGITIAVYSKSVPTLSS